MRSSSLGRLLFWSVRLCRSLVRRRLRLGCTKNGVHLLVFVLDCEIEVDNLDGVGVVSLFLAKV